MAKKPKKNKPSLLSFLLREFKGRPDPDKIKKQQEENEAAKAGFEHLDDTSSENKNPQLLPAHLRNLKIRPDQDEKKIQQEREKKLRLGGREDIEGEEEDSDEAISPEETGKNLLGGRFEVLPANPIGEDYSKRASDAARSLGGSKDQNESPSQVRRNADNYRQMYMDQRAQEVAMTMEKTQAINMENRKVQEAATKKALEEQTANTYRSRARELQTQIAWWQQQSGTGQYDDATISLNVTNLQNELGGIPSGYW